MVAPQEAFGWGGRARTLRRRRSRSRLRGDRGHLAPPAEAPESREWSVRASVPAPRRRASAQQVSHVWLFFTPSASSSAIVGGIGEMRLTGPFAMSTAVWPARLTA